MGYPSRCLFLVNSLRHYISSRVSLSVGQPDAAKPRPRRRLTDLE